MRAGSKVRIRQEWTALSNWAITDEFAYVTREGGTTVRVRYMG